jgi:hypothetical protein
MLVVGEAEGAIPVSEFAPYDLKPFITGRRIFYNFSKWDGNDAAANAADDGAIATDKTALLPGGTADFANYTSYSKGINGIMIDIANLPNNGTGIAANDFSFKVGNNNAPSSWANAATPASVSVRLGAGTNGSDRVTILWADRAIEKQWLQVTVLANADTGLVANDVFYFGNAIAEVQGFYPTGATVATVLSSDEALIRINGRNALNPPPIDFAFDINRDKMVGASDQALARLNVANAFVAIKKIQPPSGGSAPESYPVGGGIVAPTTSELGIGKSYSAINPTLPSPLDGENLPAIVVGNHTLLPNTANQAIELFVTGGQMVPGLELYVQVGDGGPERTQAGIATAGTDGPSISAVDIKTGTIFAGSSALQINMPSIPQWTDTQIALDSDVAANGKFATIYLDTTGFTSGTYDLKLSGTLVGSSVGTLDTRFSLVAAQITNGTITISAGGGGGGAPLEMGMGSETVMAVYNTLAIDMGANVRAAAFRETDFQLFTSTNRQTWSASNLVVSLSVSVGAAPSGGDLVLIRFIAPPVVEETPYFRVRLRSNLLAQHAGSTLDFDLRTWQRV